MTISNKLKVRRKIRTTVIIMKLTAVVEKSQ